MQSIEELRKLAEEQEKAKEKEENIETGEEKQETAEQNAIVESKKAIDKISVSEIKVSVDTSKSMEEQAEDVVGAMATAAAVQDEKTAQELTVKKAEELKSKATKKLTEAQAAEIDATTRKQEAERKKHEAVLETFGIKKQLPTYLRVILLAILTVPYILLNIIIGIPCGLLKVIIDNIDNVILRYQAVDDKNKPKLKVTVWILLVFAVLAAAALITLKVLGKI